MTLEIFNVILGYFCRMNVIFNSIVFGRKTERVPTHRVKNVISLKAFFSRNYINGGVGTRMSYMKALPRGIRKFNQTVKFRKSIVIFCRKGFIFIPYFLPFFFNSLIFVFHNQSPCDCFNILSKSQSLPSLHIFSRL